jgi:aminopeptidase
MDSIYSRYAELLAGYCLAVSKGDRVLIRSTYLAEPLLQEVYRGITLRGGLYDARIAIRDEEKIFLDSADDEQIRSVSPFEKIATENYRSILTIRAPFNLKSLQSIDPEKKKAAQEGRKPLHDIFSKRSSSGSLNWTLCEFPTDSSAQECGMSSAEYAEFVFSACRLYEDDPASAWQRCSSEQQRYVEYLNKVSSIRFVADGTDLTLSVKGRKWINSDGRRNMPSGEVFSAPVEDSVSGSIRFSYPVIFMGDEIEGLSLAVKDGYIADWNAAKGKRLLDRIFEIEGARRFGEVAVGLNRGVNRFTRNILFDEKMDGTIHLAIGSAYPETGGKNDSAIHLDFINDMREGMIIADGITVYEKGLFII